MRKGTRVPRRGFLSSADRGMLQPDWDPPKVDYNLGKGAATCHPLPLIPEVSSPATVFHNGLWPSSLSLHRCGIRELLGLLCCFYCLSPTINTCRVVLLLTWLLWHDGAPQVSFDPKIPASTLLPLPSSSLCASLLPVKTSSSSMATQLRSRQSPLCAARPAAGEAPRVPPWSGGRAASSIPSLSPSPEGG